MSRADISRGRRWLLIPAVAGAFVLFAATTLAQLSVRPDDPTGVSLRRPRVRVLHSDVPTVPGTSMHLQQTDPWLAYLYGRSYFFREWGEADGAFRGLPPYASVGGATTTSCGMCHNQPFPSAGAGGNGMVPVGYGRSTPHLFGAGLLEILAQQVRAKILLAHDHNHNGFLDVPAETAARRARVEASPGVWLDFGALDDADGDGRPDLDGVITAWTVDRAGQVITDSRGLPALLGDDRVAGYDFAVGIFSASASDHQFSTLRIFTLGALMVVMGIPPDDPTTRFDSGERRDAKASDGWAETSNAGAQQPYLPVFSMFPPSFAPGVRVSEGEGDLFEWYLLNHPRPAVGPQDERTRRGSALLGVLGCTTCHTRDWVIEPADPARGLPGDRRFFDLAVAYNPAAHRLEGTLRSLTEEKAGPSGSRVLLPRREGFSVEGIYSDLRHHDLGERYWEYQVRNGKVVSVLRRFRTPPLWGVGSSAPYGHDGRDPTLDDAIRRHGGEAEPSRVAYLSVDPADREAVVAFLRSLVTYQPETLPTDLNGDGHIAPSYRVGSMSGRAGREAGPERFQPELLMRVPAQYAGWTTGPNGDRYFSYRLLNLAEAYGENLEARRDSHVRASPTPVVLPPTTNR